MADCSFHCSFDPFPLSACDEQHLSLDDPSASPKPQQPIPIPSSSRTQPSYAEHYGSYGSFGSITEAMFGGDGSLGGSLEVDHSFNFLSHSAPPAVNAAGMRYTDRLTDQPWNAHAHPASKPNMLDTFDPQRSFDYALSWGSDSPVLQPQSQQTSPAIGPCSTVSTDFLAFSEPHFATVVCSSFKNDVPALASGLGPPLIDFDAPLATSELVPHKPDGFGFNANGYTIEQQISEALGDESLDVDLPDPTASLEQVQSHGSDLTASVSPELQPCDAVARQGSPGLDPPDESVADRKRKKSTGWVSMNSSARHQAAATAGRKIAGRRGPLSAKARKKAAFMRGRACASCKGRKAACDHGFACKACIRYYGKKLLDNPCRDAQTSDMLAAALLKGDPEGAGIFPRQKSLQECFGGGPLRIDRKDRTIRLSLGFGPPMMLLANLIMPADAHRDKLIHDHVVYKWPPVEGEVTQRDLCRHRVFPAQLAPQHADEMRLQQMLDKHLTLLVDKHFELFPSFESDLHILKPVIYEYYASLRKGGLGTEMEVMVLRQALKLLVLVHIGGDCHLDLTDSASITISQAIFGPLSASVPGETSTFKTCPPHLGVLPAPCYIRGQLGGVMPLLAETLMKDVLHRLEEISYGRECGMWATAVSVIAVLAMMGECVDYHAAKVGFHARLDATPTLGSTSRRYSDSNASAYSRSEGSVPGLGDLNPDTSVSDQALEHLLQFYMNCFESCHLRLLGVGAGRARSGSNAASKAAGEAQSALVTKLKDVIAASRDYLLQKTTPGERDSLQDLSWCFDRKLARVFTLSVLRT